MLVIVQVLARWQRAVFVCVCVCVVRVMPPSAKGLQGGKGACEVLVVLPRVGMLILPKGWHGDE